METRAAEPQSATSTSVNLPSMPRPASSPVSADPAASPPAETAWPELKHLSANVNVNVHVTTAATSPASNPSTATDADADAQQRNRKRQRPAPAASPLLGAYASSTSTSGSMPLADLKLDFAGFEMGASAGMSTAMGPSTASFVPQPLPSTLPHAPPVTSDTATAASAVMNGLRLPLSQPQMQTEENPREVLTFLESLPSSSTGERMALGLVVERLAQDGFDSVVALAFASADELQRAGLVDGAAVGQQARRVFAARRFQGPGTMSTGYTVSRWLMLCAVPRARAFEYAEYLCRLGYASVRDLELLLHDQRAVAIFKVGHSRLLAHCITAAMGHSQPVPQPQFVAPMQTQGVIDYGQNNPNVYNVGSSSALLQPLDIQRENEFDVQAYDSFLDALIDPSDGGAGALNRENEAVQANQGHGLTVDASFGNQMGGGRLSFGGSVAAAGVGAHVPLRMLPQEHLQLLYEAVNLPRPNPCRRGKKIYWSVLATGGMKEPRFSRLTQFSAAELQHAYLRQFELPASSPTTKMDAWSDENIRQLEQAVKDPRCRHLSKVCWEMLATGRTGVDDYMPLAKFTASQLRSRFRSLFGDKRPQKLRQKKQMLKLQQQQQQQSVAALKTENGAISM